MWCAYIQEEYYRNYVLYSVEPMSEWANRGEGANNQDFTVIYVLFLRYFAT